MLLEEETFNKEEFLESFKKRFYSFCSKSPLFLKFKMTDEGVIVYNYSKSVDEEVDNKLFRFDYSLNEKDNIFKIKQFLLENWYPVFNISIVNFEKLSPMEKQDLMVQEKLSYEDVNRKFKKTETIKTFRLEKVINVDNSLAVRDMETNTLMLYKARVPLIVITSKIFEDPDKASEIFSEKCEFVRNLNG